MLLPGRPRLLDETKQHEVCALISAGCGIAFAARYVGCSPSTIRRESIRNEDFDRRLRRACLTAQLNPLNAMREAASKHWRAAAWLLERNDPERFVKQNPKTVTVSQLKNFADRLGDEVVKEISDPRARRRLRRRFDALVRDLNRSALAVGPDMKPMPRVRRRRLQKKRDAAKRAAAQSDVQEQPPSPTIAPQTIADHDEPT